MNSPGRNEVETEAWDDQWGVGYSHKVYSTIYSLLGNAQCDGRDRGTQAERERERANNMEEK